jgi:hypothetical protein
MVNGTSTLQLSEFVSMCTDDFIGYAGVSFNVEARINDIVDTVPLLILTNHVLFPEPASVPALLPARQGEHGYYDDPGHAHNRQWRPP